MYVDGIGRVFDVDDLAAMFGRSRETIMRKARNGDLPGFKVGIAWFFREKELEQQFAAEVESRRHLCRSQEE